MRIISVPIDILVKASSGLSQAENLPPWNHVGNMGEAAYSFAKVVDWNNGLHLQAPGVLKPWSSDGH